QLSTIGVLVNLGVVPLAAAATVVGLAAVGLSFLSEAIGAVAFDAVWPILLALRVVVALAARVPAAVVHLPAPGPTAIVCYVCGLALLLVHGRAPSPGGRLVCRGVAVGLLGLAVGIAVWPLVRSPDGRLRITVLDVGQGDAVVLEMPDGRTILVDAGSGGPARPDTGRRARRPVLWH